MIVDDIKVTFTGEEIEVAKASKQEEDEVLEKELKNATKRRTKTRNNSESGKETS